MLIARVKEIAWRKESQKQTGLHWVLFTADCCAQRVVYRKFPVCLPPIGLQFMEESSGKFNMHREAKFKPTLKKEKKENIANKNTQMNFFLQIVFYIYQYNIMNVLIVHSKKHIPFMEVAMCKSFLIQWIFLWVQKSKFWLIMTNDWKYT